MNTVSHVAETDQDYNIVSLWTSVDIARWFSGMIAGAIAGGIAMVVAGALAVSEGYEFVFPIKLLGTALLGRTATQYSNTSGLLAGLIVVGFICVFWGFVFGHFVRTNRIWSLLGMGFTWGAFSWVFTWNLYLHSVKAISASNIPPGPALLVCMSYGFGMVSIALVDKVLRSSDH